MTTFEKVREIIVEQLGVDETEVTPDAKLEDDLGADSLDIVELIMFAEEDFGIEIPDADVLKYQGSCTVGKAVEYITQAVKEQRGAE